MNQKIKNLLFELTRNSRITTKELSSRLKTSQQSCSYLANMAKRKKLINEYSTVVDAVKLGYTNILVGLNYTSLDSQTKKEAIEYLKSNESVIAIEEARQGVDLIVEYCCFNLSAFNKTHSKDMEKMNKILRLKFIFPVIVKHEFLKNYFGKKRDQRQNILCGDRKLRDLGVNEKLILNALVKNPRSTLVAVSNYAKISVKTVAVIKKNLEKRAIIKGYGCSLNNEKLGINRYYLFIKLTDLSNHESNKLIEFAKTNRNVVELTKVIGNYNIMFIIEEINKNYTLKQIRETFKIEDYFIVQSEDMIKKTYLPET